MTIKRLQPDDYEAVLSIAEDLPEWFTETARHKTMPVDLRYEEGFVAWESKTVVGFITLYVAEGKLNIGWLGVRKDFQRKGVGKELLHAAEDRARELGISEIATYTLGDGIDYAPYEQTRNFYFKNGFYIYQRNKTDNPECPEEIRISKKIS
jgi:GNAT superfamily N-acetyltransferase